MRRRPIFLALLLALVVTGLGVVALVVEGDRRSDLPRPDVRLVQNDGPPPSSDLADVIEAVLPSVVNVKVTQVGFGDLGTVEEGRGEGSGVVIDPAGIVVTNYHVVQDAFEVEVAFTDGDTLRGRVIGIAPARDLALLQVDAEGLPAIELGRSEDLRLGDAVVAIGFPLGLGGATVTSGIVSATERNIRPLGGSELAGLLQTDAAINPGNSGGAMIDAAGRLVGINTAAAQAGSAENVGFAIPIDDAIDIIQEMLDAPGEEQSWLGVALDTQTDRPAALIIGIYPDSPAEEAGLEAGDAILSVDGEPVESAQELIDRIADRPPGATVVLVVSSEAGDRDVRLTLGTRPATFVRPD